MHKAVLILMLALVPVFAQTSEETARLESEIGQFERVLEERRSEQADIERELATLGVNLDERIRERDRISAQLGGLREERGTLETDLQTLTVQAAENEARILELEAELEVLRARLRRLFNELYRERTARYARVLAESETMFELRVKNFYLARLAEQDVAVIQQADRTVQELAARQATLTAQIAEQNQKAVELANTVAQLDVAQSSLERIIAELEGSREGQLAQRQALLREQTQLEGSLMMTRQQLEAEVARLQREAEELRRRQEEARLAAERAERQRQEQERQRQEAERQRLEAEARRREEQARALQEAAAQQAAAQQAAAQQAAAQQAAAQQAAAQQAAQQAAAPAAPAARPTLPSPQAQAAAARPQTPAATPQESPRQPPATAAEASLVLPFPNARLSGVYGSEGSYVLLRADADGTAVRAAMSGTVHSVALVSANSGYLVAIHHSAQLMTAYLNLQAPSLRVGDRVNQGQIIGYLGGGTLTRPDTLKFFLGVPQSNGSAAWIDPTTRLGLR